MMSTQQYGGADHDEDKQNIAGGEDVKDDAIMCIDCGKKDSADENNDKHNNVDTDDNEDVDENGDRDGYDIDDN